jgi:hypothetical protein
LVLLVSYFQIGEAGRTYEDQGHVDTDLENKETLGTDSVRQARMLASTMRERIVDLHLDSVGDKMR